MHRTSVSKLNSWRISWPHKARILRCCGFDGDISCGGVGVSTDNKVFTMDTRLVSMACYRYADEMLKQGSEG